MDLGFWAFTELKDKSHFKEHPISHVKQGPFQMRSSFVHLYASFVWEENEDFMPQLRHLDSTCPLSLFVGFPAVQRTPFALPGEILGPVNLRGVLSRGFRAVGSPEVHLQRAASSLKRSRAMLPLALL